MSRLVGTEVGETGKCLAGTQNGDRSGGGVRRGRTLKPDARTAESAVGVWIKMGKPTRSFGRRSESLAQSSTHSPSLAAASPKVPACRPPLVMVILGGKRSVFGGIWTTLRVHAAPCLGSYDMSCQRAPDSPVSLGGRWLKDDSDEIWQPWFYNKS